MSTARKRKWMLPVLLLLVVMCLPVGASNPRAVILITIDGMRREMVTDSTMPSPFLKLMARDGMMAERVVGVPPSATYPSHTTIVTGVVPARHHIYYNRPFGWNKPGPKVSYWWADSIAAPTIWQQAKEHGLTTASLFWPVSTGCRWIDYNVPEFWDATYSHSQTHWLAAECTPRGLLEKLEQNACGAIDSLTLDAGSTVREGRTAFMANYIIDHYNPQLMTIHLITTDYAQHATGTESEQTRAAVAAADYAVGVIVEHLRRSHRLDSTQVIVTGDHGFVNVKWWISPNVWLVKSGLLSSREGGEWKACFYAAGATAFLYLKDAKDDKTLRCVRKILDGQPAAVRALYRVVEKAELSAKGADPRVALALEPVAGAEAMNFRDGEAVRPHGGGTHGYLSTQDPTVFIAYGAGVEKGLRVKEIRQVDIAPYVLRQLGIKP